MPIRDETDQLICDCEVRDEDLTDWEANFIQSIREQYDRKGFLSDKQLDILNKIWDRVT